MVLTLVFPLAAVYSKAKSANIQNWLLSIFEEMRGHVVGSSYQSSRDCSKGSLRRTITTVAAIHGNVDRCTAHTDGAQKHAQRSGY
jgi:hypothetical protein